MWRNAYAINEMLNNPVDVRTKTKHPEMKEVKYGDRLMSIKFSDQFEDPMYKALGDRITELEEQKDDDEDQDQRKKKKKKKEKEIVFGKDEELYEKFND